MISDTHFGHQSCWEKFKRADGSPLRDFKSTEEMDETMIERWNAIVGPKDVVYHLGDVVINRRYMTTLGRLNGRKKLVRGNHDIFATEDYFAYFEEIHGVVKLDVKGEKSASYYLTHIPIHPESIPKWCDANVHGHLHATRVLDKWGKIDPRYICVSVEHTNYAPVPVENLDSYR